MRVKVHFLAAQHRPGRNADPLQRVHQVVLILLASPLADGRVNLVVPLLTAGQGLQACIAGQVVPLHQAAEGLPLGVVRHRKRNPLVVARRRIGSLRRTVGMPVADAISLPTVDHGVHQVLRQEHHPRLVHPDVHPLPLAGAVTVAQRGTDGEHRAPGGQKVDERPPGLGRLVARIAGNPAVPVGAFLRGGLCRIGRIRPVAMPVAGVGHHDDVGSQLAQVGIVQSPASHHPRREVLHHHVADHHQLAENFPALLPGHIQHQRALAPVEQLVGRWTVPPVFARLVVGKGSVQSAAAGDVGATRPLNLDDLRAQVGQLPARVGKRKHVGGIQNPNAFQRQRGHSATAPFQITSVCRITDSSCGL